MEHRYVCICLMYENVKVYGIAEIDETDGCPIISEFYIDLCTDKKEVDRLVDMCNALELDPIHLREVVEDFLLSL